MTYYMALAATILVTVALSACLQTLFAVLGNQDLLSLTEAALCVVLGPLLFFVAGIICDEMVDVVYDAMDKPPLVRTRAILCAALASDEEGVFRVGLWVHVAIIIGLELIPIAVGLTNVSLNEGSELRFFASGYILGGLCFATVLALSYLVAHVYMLRNREAQDFMYDLVRALDHREGAAGFGDSLVHPLVGFSTPEEDALVTAPDFRGALIRAALAVFIFLAVSVLVSLSSLNYVVGIALMACALLLCAKGTSKAFPRLLGGGFHVLMTLYLVLAAALPVFSHASIFSLDEQATFAPLFKPLEGANANTQQADSDEVRYRYPVCDMRWGHASMPPDERLTALDLLSLSYQVYYPSDEDLVRTAEAEAKGTALEGVIVEEVEDYQTIGRWAVFSYPRQKLKVVAVRGTATIQEAMYDLDMLTSVQVIQFFDVMTSILGLLPIELIQEVAGAVRVRQWFDLEPAYQRLVRTVERLVEESQATGFQVIITGHSLGGLFAAVVSSRTGIPALAFSPPGQRLNQHRLGVSDSGLYKSLTIIRSDGDIVPAIDQQQGFTQSILCTPGELDCHQLQVTACELYKNCGDVRGRAMNVGCP